MLRRFFTALLLVVALVLPGQAQSEHRIVSLNGDITEILFALGLGDQIVAVDASSNYPEEANSLPNLGYQRTLSAEAILSYAPTLVIANQDAGPPEVLDQVRAAGVEVVIIEADHTLATPAANIRRVASLLGVGERGEELAQALEAKIAAAAEQGAALPKQLRVMFLYLGSRQAYFAGGLGTPSNAMIVGAGAIDAGAEIGFRGYMPITPEAMVAAQPDLLIVTDRGLAMLGSLDAVLQIPGVAQTPAGQQRNIIVFEDLYFIGMGPRTGDALLELVEALRELQ